MINDTTKVVDKLKKIVKRACEKQKYDMALSAIAACASIFYSHNQFYTDDDLENSLLMIGEQIFCEKICTYKESEPNKYINETKKTVLFYDGFGLDTRGLALIYLKALVENEYRVIYVTKKEAEGKQPEIDKVVNGYNIEKVFITMNRSYSTWINELANVFDTFQPNTAFFYTTPYDVAATIVFNEYAHKVTRYQIDLTDHAFWLGKNAFDFCIELRDVGSKISSNYRKIPEKQLVMLPYYAVIDKKTTFKGFPFSDKGFRVVFSGGALYKTHGDSENKYYRIVDSILDKHKDIIFLYAGYGDDTQLEVLKKKYCNRVYHIGERADLYQVMQNSVLYLNTYPMFGGLMMHYAVSAGKIPITLKHNHDADGLLFNQSEIGIEYDTMEELLLDVDKLLTDSEYLAKREALLSECSISEKKFKDELKTLIETGCTSYNISTEYIDTSQFREEYDERFVYTRDIRNAIASRNNLPLALKFPGYFIELYYRRIRMKFFGGRK